MNHTPNIIIRYAKLINLKNKIMKSIIKLEVDKKV